MAFVYHHVFCDESGKYQSDPLIAFCAVTATDERLERFDKEWRELLRNYEITALHMAQHSRLMESDGYRFKKGDTLEERTMALFPFADLINKHLETGVIQAWDVRGFNHLSRAVLENLGGSNDPYFLALIRGLEEIADKTGDDDRINIIFDDDPFTAWDCYVHYRSLANASPKAAKKAVSLSFANDKHFPALQAADMVAFLTRFEANEKFNRVPNIWRTLYDRLKTEPLPPYGLMRWTEMFADEQLLVDFARENEAVAKEQLRLRQENRDRIRKVQRDNAKTNPGSTQPDKGKVRGGKGGKKKKAEG